MPRMTKQKKTLYEALSKMKSFFGAVELHEQSGPLIGIATVYRFLNTIEKQGEVHAFMCGGRKIYSREKKSHAHFHCERCGKLQHIMLHNVDFLEGQNVGDVCHFQIELHGICKKCKNK